MIEFMVDQVKYLFYNCVQMHDRFGGRNMLNHATYDTYCSCERIDVRETPL